MEFPNHVTTEFDRRSIEEGKKKKLKKEWYGGENAPRLVAPSDQEIANTMWMNIKRSNYYGNRTRSQQKTIKQHTL